MFVQSFLKKNLMMEHKKILSYFLLLHWFLLLASINTYPFEISYFGEGFIKSLNAIRLLLALISSVLLVTYTCYIFILKNIKINKVNLYFLIIFTCQLLGLYLNKARDFDISNIYLVILSFGVICLFILISHYKLKEIYKYFFTALIIFLIAATIITLLLKLKDINFLNFYEIFNEKSSNILLQVNARITGLSRMLAIINLFLFIYFFKLKISFFKTLVGFFFFTNTVILLFMQSRGTLLCYFVSILFIIFFLYDIKKDSKAKIIFVFIIIPVLFYYFIYNFSSKNLYEEKIIRVNRLASLDTSGRTVIWSYTLKNYDYKKIFGYGPNGDRFFLNEFDKKEYFGDNSSNAIIYTLLSGGVASLFFLGLIFYEIFITIKNILKNKIRNFSKKSIIFNLSLVYLLFFLIRSIFENSFGLFSVDFLITYISLSYISNISKEI
jgi:hypothetical protein